MSFKSAVASIWYNLSKIFVPTSAVAGLQITDSSLRYVELKPNGKSTPLVVADRSLRLPPGIMENGRIKDRGAFLAALRSLKRLIALNSKRKLNVILTVPAGNVYAQSFSVPKLSGVALEEAVKLNLQVISPNPLDKTYYSWKIVGGQLQDSNQMEILGVFALRELVDELSSVVEEASFGIAAIEFSGLSFVRILNSLGIAEPSVTYLLIKLTQDGLVFMIIKNEELYFNYFHSWGKIAYENGSIPVSSALDIIKTESQRIMNFYYSHRGEQIKDIILISPVLSVQIADLIKSEYPTLKLSMVDSSKSNFHGALGAALRGLIPRIQDEDINLMGAKVMNAFWRDQVFNFIAIWRNTVLLVMGFMIIVFATADLFLIKQSEEISMAAAIDQKSAAGELETLRSKAEEFNTLVASALKARDLTRRITPFMNNLNSIASENGVTFPHIGFSVAGLTINLSGAAPAQDKIINFKNKLAAVSNVAAVSLPLSGIAPGPSGGFTFLMTVTLKAL